jgi:TolA-binding protein
VIIQMLMEISDSTFVAPGAALVAFATGIGAGAKFYKEARQIDVEGEKNRRIAAEAREKQAGESTAAKVDELTKQVKTLQEQVEQLRVDHEARLLDERGKNFQLRQLLKDNGIAFPKELGPS